MPTDKRFLEESASFTLGAMASTVGGVLFVMLAMNLARYVGAVNAVEQAARATARCITPTDPRCISSQSGQIPSTDANWFAPVNSPASPVTYVDYYQYDASVTEQTWQASASGFDVATITPEATLPVFNLPLRQYQQVAWRYEERWATPTVTVTYPGTFYFTPLAEPQNFPSFRQAYEQSVDTNNSWSPRNARGGSLGIAPIHDEWIGAPRSRGAQPADVSGRVISAGARSGNTFNSGWITIPILDAPATATSPVFSSSGTSFDLNSVPHGGQNPDWSRFAHVAIKADAQVRRSNANNYAEVRWGHSTQPGLTYIVCDRNGSCSGERALGGRTNSDTLLASSDTNWRWYNLWLRGPSGAHGGDPNTLHQGIQVERGGRIRLFGTIYANNPHGDIEAKMRFRVYQDGYAANSTAGMQESFDCTPQQLTPARPDPVCPPDPYTDCGVPNYVQNINQACTDTRTSISSCQPSANSFRIAEHRDNAIVEVAACRSAVTPSNLDLNPNIYGACPWQWEEVGTSSTTLPSPHRPSSCTTQNAPQSDLVLSCPTQTANPANNYDCPELANSLSSLNAAIDSYNQAKTLRTSAVRQFTYADTQWQSSALQWQFSWLRPRYPDGALVTSPQAIRPRTVGPISASNVLARIANRPPTAGAFDWSSVGSPPPNSVPVSFSYIPGNDRSVSIQNDYPFTGVPVPEIPYWGQAVHVADYDLDCTLESSCSASHTAFSSLSEALRHYAQNRYPELSDPQIAFQHSPPALAFREAVSASDPHALFRSCTPFYTASCQSDTPPTIISLGSLPLNIYPQGPAECSDGTYQNCFSEVAPGSDISTSDPTVVLNAALAEQVGFQEMQRIFRDANFGCSGPNCVSIAIDTDSGPLADIQVAYEMPVTFPFNTIIGADSLTVSHRKMETQELASLR